MQPSPPTRAAESRSEQTPTTRRIGRAAATVVAFAVIAGAALYYRTVVEENARIERLRQEKAQVDAEAARQSAEAETKRHRLAEEEAESARLTELEAERKRLAEVEVERKRLELANAELQRQAGTEAGRRRIAEAQAERTRHEAEATRKQAAAEAEFRRQAEAQMQRQREIDVQALERQTYQSRLLRATQTTAFSGSLIVSITHFARALGVKPGDLEPRQASSPCKTWASELALDNRRDKIFRSICPNAMRFATANGCNVTTQPEPQQWSKFCISSAGRLSGDERKTFISTCQDYR